MWKLNDVTQAIVENTWGVGVTPAAPAASNPTVEYLIVGGGGAGSGAVGGGGGGGGVVSGNIIANTAYQYTITVGAGGAGTNNRGGGGEYSLFNNIIAFGGGWSGFFGDNGVTYANSSIYGFKASAGGQGGSSIDFRPHSIFPGQGNRSGNCVATAYTAGGGGGAGEAALNANNTHSTRGGNGIFSSISGTSVAYAGGGNGAAHQSGKSTPNVTAAGGGALGGVTETATGGTGIARGANGSINSGGGGGGGGYSGSPFGGSGGSGVTILSYSTSFANATSTGSPTYSEASGNRIFTFTGSGTITF
jgi:hypothetical protein